MRPIKFRGKAIWGDEFLYGDLTHFAGNHVAIFGYRQGEVGHWEIEPDTAAQLVGYDKNGKEVYEGDELTDNRASLYGDKVTAVLQPYIRHEPKGFGESPAEYFDRFWSKPLIEDWDVKLKENNQ